jgi:hypothetical protein
MCAANISRRKNSGWRRAYRYRVAAWFFAQSEPPHRGARMVALRIKWMERAALRQTSRCVREWNNCLFA